MRKTLLHLLVLCLLPLPAAAQSACPASLDSSKARASLVSLFNTEEFMQTRLTWGRSPMLDETNIRVLTDARDTGACQSLRQRVQADPYINQTPWQSVFYEADGWYFVVNLKYPLDQHEIRVVNGQLSGTYYVVPVDAYNANLNWIGGWGV